MNDTVLALLVIYAGITLVMFIVGAVDATRPHASRHDTKSAARLALLAPVWPLALLVTVFVGGPVLIVRLWRLAHDGK